MYMISTSNILPNTNFTYNIGFYIDCLGTAKKTISLLINEKKRIKQGIGTEKGYIPLQSKDLALCRRDPLLDEMEQTVKQFY